MAKPSFPAPGSIARVSGVIGENGNVGFIRNSKPINGDDVKVTIVEGQYKGATLSYRLSSLEPVT